jgi:hypothetical protein
MLVRLVQRHAGYDPSARELGGLGEGGLAGAVRHSHDIHLRLRGAVVPGVWGRLAQPRPPANKRRQADKVTKRETFLS